MPTITRGLIATQKLLLKILHQITGRKLLSKILDQTCAYLAIMQTITLSWRDSSKILHQTVAYLARTQC